MKKASIVFALAAALCAGNAAWAHPEHDEVPEPQPSLEISKTAPIRRTASDFRSDQSRYSIILTCIRRWGCGQESGSLSPRNRYGPIPAPRNPPRPAPDEYPPAGTPPATRAPDGETGGGAPQQQRGGRRSRGGGRKK